MLLAGDVGGTTTHLARTQIRQAPGLARPILGRADGFRVLSVEQPHRATGPDWPR
jgi:hypothetical protein